jgi:beta-aspartyl-peptidase (threonine type)
MPRAFLLLMLSAPADPPAVGEVRALLDRQVADWNRKDLDGFLAGYWDSPDVVFQSGADRTRGFAAMRDRYRKNYQAEGKAMGTLAFSDVEVELLAHDVALARGRWALVKPDGSRPHGLFTLIVKRLPGGWKIVHDHTSIGAN